MRTAGVFAAVSAELFKVVKRPAMWMIFGLWMILSLLFGYVFPYFSYRDASGAKALGVLSPALPGGLVGSATSGFPMFAGALALIIGALGTGSEYNWDTVKTMLTIRPRRWQLLAGKVATMVVVMAAIVLVTFALDAGAAAVVSAITGHSSAWPSAGTLVRGYFGGLLVVGMWCLVGMMLGIVLKGTSLSVGLGLVWALALENLIRAVANVLGPIDALSKYLPGTNAGALVAALGAAPQGSTNGTPGVVDVVSGTHAAIVVSAYVVAAVAAAMLVLRRRDVG